LIFGFVGASSEDRLPIELKTSPSQLFRISKWGCYSRNVYLVAIFRIILKHKMAQPFYTF